MTALAAALVASLVLAALAVLQVLVASGRPYGRLVWGGRHQVLPQRLRVGSAVSVVVYALIAAQLLLHSSTSGPVSTWRETVTWVLVAYFAIGVAVNGSSRSRPERFVMTPVCAVLAGCAAIVALA